MRYHSIPSEMVKQIHQFICHTDPLLPTNV